MLWYNTAADNSKDINKVLQRCIIKDNLVALYIPANRPCPIEQLDLSERTRPCIVQHMGERVEAALVNGYHKFLLNRLAMTRRNQCSIILWSILFQNAIFWVVSLLSTVTYASLGFHDRRQRKTMLIYLGSSLNLNESPLSPLHYTTCRERINYIHQDPEGYHYTVTECCHSLEVWGLLSWITLLYTGR